MIEQRDPRFIALSGAYPNACLFRLKADLPDVVDARLLRFLFYLEILTLAKIADGANRGGNPARPGGNNIRLVQSGFTLHCERFCCRRLFLRAQESGECKSAFTGRN